MRQALSEAFAHRSYVLLVLGFFTCGFQLAFITVHLPSYLVDRGLSSDVGGWTIAAIGLFNVVGSLTSGWLCNYLPKRYILSVIYFGRALAVLAFIMFPVTPLSSILFGAVMGFLWLSTVAPTNGIIMLMFGTRWLATLAGFAFFSHQVGGFLGVWLGGVVFERTGSYDAVWWLAILFGVASAISICRSWRSRLRARRPRRPDVTAESQPAWRRTTRPQPRVLDAIRPMRPRARSRTPRHLAGALRRHSGLRLPDRHARLRPALGARIFPHADVERARLGPRRLCARARDPDAAVGRGPAASRARSPIASAPCQCSASAPPLRARPRR